MRLAEALLRVPDAETAIALTADQLGRADFDRQRRRRRWRSLSAARRSRLSKKFLPAQRPAPRRPDGAAGRAHGGGGDAARGAVAGPPVRAGPEHRGGDGRGAIGPAPGPPPALQLRHAGRRRAHRRRRAALPRQLHGRDRCHRCVAQTATGAPEQNDGISIKLSALHPRYEDAQRERVLAELVPRVWQLCELAADANINLTIDAEEVDRLELSLDVFEALAARVAAERPAWRGFGLALQAYQTRALELVEHVVALARKHRLRFMCRLVKGAYWDAEIKRAQELGLPHYPVFTHKHHTDVSLPGLRARPAGRARRDLPAVRHPQRRHHRGDPADGAGTERAVRAAAAARHGRRRLPRGAAGPARRRCASMRRSASTATCWPTWCGGCWRTAPTPPSCTSWPTSRCGWTSCWPRRCGWSRQPSLPLPPDLLRRQRARNSAGPGPGGASRMRAAAAGGLPPTARARGAAEPTPRAPPTRWQRSAAAYASWRRDARWPQRAAMLRRAADAMQAAAAAPVRAAGQGGVQDLGRRGGRSARGGRLPALLRRRGRAHHAAGAAARPDRRDATSCGCAARGAWVCISPWNFPLAIFTGQVAAALATGNTVLAKPAEQTPGGRAGGGASCCTRPACPPTRCSCCTAPARRSARRWWPTPRHRRRGVHRLDRRWPGSSTARWPPRTAPSCR